MLIFPGIKANKISFSLSFYLVGRARKYHGREQAGYQRRADLFSSVSLWVSSLRIPAFVYTAHAKAFCHKEGAIITMGWWQSCFFIPTWGMKFLPNCSKVKIALPKMCCPPQAFANKSIILVTLVTAISLQDSNKWIGTDFLHAVRMNKPVPKKTNNIAGGTFG